MKKSFIRGVLFFLFILLSICIITGCPGPETPDGGSQTGGSNTGSGTGGGNTGSGTGGGNTGSGSGSGSGSNINPSTPSTNASGKVNDEYWGTWIFMDNGNPILITDEGVNSDWYEAYDIKNFQLESVNVLAYKEGNTVRRLFRQSGYARSFSVKVAGLEGSRAADNFKKFNSAKKNVKVNRKTKTIASDVQERQTDSAGVAEFSDAVAGETQQITIKSGNANVNLELTPHFDGEDMGVIPVIEPGNCSFKASYDITTSSEYLYANRSYGINLNIQNIGDEEISLGYYMISCDDANLNIQGNLAASLGTVEPYGADGDKKEIPLTVTYDTMNDEYRDVKINVIIQDYETNRQWNDYITLRFYRRPVCISVNAYSTTNSGSLHGFVIAPGRKVQVL